jgi:hypothetical protein
MFHVLSEKEGGSWGAITGDIKDQSIDIGDRAFASLLKPRREAREAIFPGPNGFPLFALFNGDGVLQDEVPPDIAIDTTIPAPHTRRLQPAAGCIRCHGGDGSDGWKPLRNDVQALLRGRLDIFGDLSKRAIGDADTLDRLAGLYTADPAKPLRRARDDYAEAVLKAGGPWRESVKGQADAVQIASKRLEKELEEWTYDLVDARQALREIGIEAAEGMAQAVFTDLVAPDVNAEVGGLVIEDPRIAAIRAGIGVTRPDFALVQSVIAERAMKKVKVK